MIRQVSILSLLFFSWQISFAQEQAVLVKDINPGLGSSDPTGLVKVGDALFFSASSGNGQEFWKSDGTEAGTVMVKNRASMGCLDIIPLRSYILNDVVYFGDCGYAADNEASGLELWKTDGTEAGTVMVKDIFPGSDGSGVSDFAELNGALYFGANDGTNGRELWKTDGTEAGTVMVKDIRPGLDGAFSGSLVNVGGVLFFGASDGVLGTELWKSDGTEAGTVLVKDINTGSGSSQLGHLTNVNGTLFFSAWDGENGTELWKSDGTEGGTVMVKDINPGTDLSISYDPQFTDVNGTLFFIALDGTHGAELWKSDGTEAGTVMVKDIRSGEVGSISDAYNFTDVNGTLFFVAHDGEHADELWKSDGTEAGTVMVKDIAAGMSGSNPSFLTNVNGTLYFSADDDADHGVEVWKSDGTEAGTVRVTDIRPGSGNGNPNYLTNVNGTLFFHADNGISSYGGGELWKLTTTDGTPTDENSPILATIGNKEVDEGETLSFTVSATAEDGATLTFSLDATSEGKGMTLGGETGAFSWTPESAQVGDHEVTITVSDGELEDSETFTITVNAANDPVAGTFDGTWNGNAVQDNIHLGTFVMHIEGEAVSGSYNGENENFDFEGSINSSGGISIQISTGESTISVTASISGDNLSGSWVDSNGESGSIAGTKATEAFDGTYSGGAFVGGEQVGSFTVEITNGKVSGLYTEDGETTPINGYVDENGDIRFNIYFEEDESVTTVDANVTNSGVTGTFSNTLSGSGTISGTKTDGTGDVDDPVLGLETESGLFKIFPNPTTDILHIERLANDVRPTNIRIVTLAGRVVMKQKLGADALMDIGSLKPGIYLLTIGLNDGGALGTFRVKKE